MTPTPAQRIVAAIEHELGERRGLGWSGLDEEVALELRDKLAAIVDRHLAQQQESR